LELTECWRPYPDFVGPVMPPMIAALKHGRYADGYWLKDKWWLAQP
jgi:hypothetical protein